MKQLQENPLSPFIVIHIRGIDLPVPVKGIAEGVELALEPLDVVFRHHSRVDVILNCVILRGKSESVPAHGIEHVVALHSSLPCHNVKRRVRSRMPHVKPLSRRIRELNQRIIFRLGIIVRGFERLFVIPDLLPFALYFSVIVWYRHFPTCSFLYVRICAPAQISGH